MGSNWNTYTTPPRDSSRLFSGRIAQGACSHWNPDGSPAAGCNFSNGELSGTAAMPPAQTRQPIGLATLSGHWLWTGMSGGAGYNEADLNADGTVNFMDLALAAAQP